MTKQQSQLKNSENTIPGKDCLYRCLWLEDWVCLMLTLVAFPTGVEPVFKP